MEEQMTNLRLTDFEFFKIILPGSSRTKLKLPEKFARELGDRELRDAKLRVAGAGRRLWDVKVFDDDVNGDVYLGRGWQEFARAHDLRDGHFLVFRYDGAAAFTVTVFDETMCRREYRRQHDAADSGSSSSDGSDAAAAEGVGDGGGDVATSQFAVTLRQCNLGEKQAQYLLTNPTTGRRLAGGGGGGAERAGGVPGGARVREEGEGGAADARGTMDGEAEAQQAGARPAHGVPVRLAPVLRRQRPRRRRHLLLPRPPRGRPRPRRRRRRPRAQGRRAQGRRHHPRVIDRSC